MKENTTGERPVSDSTSAQAAPPAPPQFIPMQNPYPGLPVYFPFEKEKIVFDSLDCVLALLSLFFGWIFVKFVMWGTLGASVTVFLLLTIFLTFIYMKGNGLTFTPSSFLSVLTLAVFSFNFCISANGFIKFLDLIFLILGGTYFVYAAFRNTGKIKRGFLRDLATGLFTVPFSRFGACPRAAVQLFGRKKATAKLKWILPGLIIAVPLTAICAALLFSGDEMFRQMFSSLFSGFLPQFFLFVLQFGIGVPLAFWFFGLLYGSKTPKEKTEEDYALPKPFPKAPPLLLYSALTPLCVLYVMYFIAQSGYFLSAFKNLLPAGFGYAQYARQGFFELCVVCLINLAVICTVILLCKRRDNILPKTAKAYCAVLSVCTLVLIASALSKMIMYINCYGLTALRIYTSWVMALAACLFVLIIIKLLKNKFRFQRWAVITFVLLFAVLSFSNISGLTAKYNVQWYKEGKIGWMGSEVLYDLDDGAVEYIAPLLNDKGLDSDALSDCRQYLQNVCNRYSSDLMNFTLTSNAAHEELIRAGIVLQKGYDPDLQNDENVFH